MIDLKALAGKTALVTGAADGIGRMLANGFASLGMHVGVLDIREAAAEAAAEAIGERAFPLVADVSDRDQLFEVADNVRSLGNGLSCLWINAGVGVGAKLVDGKPNAVEWGMNVNALGVIWSAQAFVPLMRETDGPRHVGFTASSAALRSPEGDFPLYAATKHCTFGLAEGVAGELKADGIPSTILCPGLFNTDIWDAARARPEKYGGERRMDPGISGYWRAAQTPDIMWPHIEKSIANGGGYLSLVTDYETKPSFLDRAKAIADGIVELVPTADETPR